MNGKKTTASKNETNTKSIKITDETTEKTAKATEQQIEVKDRPTQKSKGHATMTDVQKPKAGQAVAVSTSPVKSKTSKKPSTIRKSQPAAQLRAGKKVQVISASTTKPATKSTSTTQKTAKSTYQEVTLGGVTKDTNKNVNIKTSEKSQATPVTAKTSLPLSKTVPKKMQLSFFRKIHLRPTQIAGCIAVLLLVTFFGRVAIWEHFYLARMEGSERHTTSEIESDNEIIEEDEWSDERKDAYEVAADKPRFLSIPSIGIYRSPIMEVGINSRGEMATPPYLYNVGWYTGSSLPGTNGVSVIDGHGGPYSNAVFENLPSLAVGAEIIIEMGDGRVFNYYVADVANKAIGEEANSYMTNAFRSPETGRGSLTLITCTGDWVVRDNIRTYSHRLFVRALLDPSQSAAAPAANLPTVQIPQVIGTPSSPNTNQPSTGTPGNSTNTGNSNNDNPNSQDKPSTDTPGSDDDANNNGDNNSGNSGNETPPQPSTPDSPDAPETPEVPEAPDPPVDPTPEDPPTETPPADTASGEENG